MQWMLSAVHCPLRRRRPSATRAHNALAVMHWPLFALRCVLSPLQHAISGVRRQAILMFFATSGVARALSARLCLLSGLSCPMFAVHRVVREM